MTTLYALILSLALAAPGGGNVISQDERGYTVIRKPCACRAPGRGRPKNGLMPFVPEAQREPGRHTDL